MINDHKIQWELKAHSSNEVIDYRTQGEWKIQLTIIINFIYSKDSDEIHTMYSKSINIENMAVNEIDKVIQELFESLLQKFQEGLEEKMRGRELVFDNIDLLRYSFHKTSLNRAGSYRDSPKWLKNKKETINPKNNDSKYFQYAIMLNQLKRTHKEYQQLNLLVISIIGRK